MATLGAERSGGPPAQSATEQKKEGAQEKAQEVGAKTRDQAREITGQAKGRVQEEVDRRSTQVGEQVSSNAQDLRSVAEELRSQGKDTPAQLAEQIAARADRVGSYLKDADGDRILGDVEDLARRQPWAVVAAGIGLGFLASRFLKASGTRRYEARTGISGHRSTRSHDELRETVDEPRALLAQQRALEDEQAMIDVPPGGPVQRGTLEEEGSTSQGAWAGSPVLDDKRITDVPPGGPLTGDTSRFPDEIGERDPSRKAGT